MDALLSVLLTISIGLMIYGSKHQQEDTNIWTSPFGIGACLLILLFINAFSDYSIIPKGLLD